MSDLPERAMQDQWERWLRYDRQAGDRRYEEALRARVAGYVDRLLDRAALAPGMRVLDVGTGEGGVAWRAIERIGPSLEVILADQSHALLAQAAATAQARLVAAQCSFVCLLADDLAPIASASVDAVTTRSTLAYVADKRAALRGFLRVLRPGGRISLAEPLFQDDAFDANLLRHRLTTQPAAQHEAGLALMHRWKAAQFPDTLEGIAATPWTSYSDRDLMRMTLAAGFVDVDLTVEIRTGASLIPSWKVLLGFTPHPWAPSLGEIMAQHFSAEERAEFETILRPRVEQQLLIDTDRMVYLTARRPGR